MFSIGLAAALTLAGCPQRHIEPRDIRPLYNSNATRIEGLRTAVAKSGGAPVYVLVLHGMVTHSRGYSDALQEKVGERLSLTKGATTGPVTLVRGYEFTVYDGPQPFDFASSPPTSEVARTAWRDRSGKERLIFYEVLWAPLRDAVKNTFIACFESGVDAPECEPTGGAQRNGDRQALVNRSLKNGLMISGFADATIVVGGVGDVLKDDVRLAMCTIAADVLGRSVLTGEAKAKRCDFAALVPPDQQGDANEKLRTAHFFALTHSLGSFLLLDAQERFASTRAVAATDVHEETSAFHLLDDATMFMRANQISLLQLARLSAKCQTEGSPCPNRLLGSNAEIFKQPSELPSMTTYVAFNDNNDLLGFELPPYKTKRGSVGTLVNVSVRNPGWRIPWIVRSPSAAHLASEDNPAIIEAIVDGLDLPPRPK